MSDRKSELFKAMAEVEARRNHAEACGKVIRQRAGAWLSNAHRASKRLDPESDYEALDPRYNDVGRLNFARAEGILRNLRDGY